MGIKNNLAQESKIEQRSHKKLDVWKRAMELATEIYKVTKKFPKEEIYGLTSQMRRAAVSVPSNISEGAARSGPKVFLHFINIAQGSLSEIDTQIDLSNMLGYIDDGSYENIQRSVAIVSKQLFGLTRSIKNKM